MEELGYEEPTLANRFGVRRWRELWGPAFDPVRVKSETAEIEDSEAIAIASRACPARPWSDYDTVRMVALPLALLCILFGIVTAAHRIMTMFSMEFGGSGLSAIFAAAVASSTLSVVPILRRLGRDQWLLRRELRSRIEPDPAQAADGADSQAVDL
jgi:hypothetical protein